MTDEGATILKRRALNKRAVADAIAAKGEFSSFHFEKSSLLRDRADPPRRRVWGASRRVRDAIAQAQTHIHGIGVGRKIVCGQYTNDPSVRVYVTQKLPEAQLPAAARVPRAIGGIPTDVVESAPAYLAAPPVPPTCSLRRTKWQRPLQAGISGSGAAVNAGTLGALCRSTRPSEQNELYVLGANHTFADLGQAPLGAPIVQPSPRDGGTATETIARLVRFAPIDERANAANLVDAALAVLDGAVPMEPRVCSIGSVIGVLDTWTEVTVAKHGRTTGLTRGVIDDPSVDVIVPLSRTNPDRVGRFVRQLRIRPSAGMAVFAQGGDSGALVITRNSALAVGLLFACPDNGTYAYASPIAEVLRALEIELI